MLALGVITVLSTWALFIYQSVTARSEALAASRSQHINLALVVSESLKQMTDRPVPWPASSRPNTPIPRP